MAPHKIQHRVYYEDTDAGGIVYYANYFKFAERGRTEYLRAAGFENKILMEKDGLLFVVRRVEADYLSSGRLDDILDVETVVESVKNASFTMKQTIKCGERLLCSMVVVLACVDLEGRLAKLPEALKGALK